MADRTGARNEGVQLLGGADDERAWSEFVDRCPEATVYHSLAWRDLIKREYGFAPHYLAFWTDARIAGILPLFYIRNFTGKKLVSLPGAMYAGPASTGGECSQRLLEAAREYSQSKHIRLQVPVAESLIDATEAEPLEIDSRVAITAETKESLRARLPSSIKHSLSRNFKSNIDIRFGRHELLNDLYSILIHSRRQLGLPLPRREYFGAILDGVDGGVVAAYTDQAAVAACLYLADAHHVHYAVAAALPAARKLGAADRLIWELLLLARERQKTQLCLGGSPAWHQGLISFKQRWASVQSPVYGFPYRKATAGADAVKKRGIRAIKFIPARLLGPASRFAIKHFY